MPDTDKVDILTTISDLLTKNPKVTACIIITIISVYVLRKALANNMIKILFFILVTAGLTYACTTGIQGR